MTKPASLVPGLLFSALLTVSVSACGDDAAPPTGGGSGSPGFITGAGGTLAGSAGTAAAAQGGAGAAGTSVTAGRSGSGAAGTAAGGGGGGAGAAGAAGSAAGADGSAGGSAGSAGSAGGAAGADAGSGGAGAGGSGGSGGTAGSGTTPGNGGTLNATIVVAAGQTFDGQGKRYRAGSALGDGSQSENQQPLFKLEKGAKLMNVVLGNPAADGIHCHGDATLQNIVWEDIGEDAMTIKESGTVTLDGGSATNGDDKVFQINAASTFKVSNFKASNAGKFIRQNGDTTFKVDVEIDRCDISNMDEAIFRTDSSTSTVKMTNTRYSQIGDTLFVGVRAGNITQSGNTEY